VSIVRLRSYVFWYALSALFLFIAFTPLIDVLPLPDVRSHAAQQFFRLALIALTPISVWLAMRTLRGSSQERAVAIAISIGCGALCEVTHYWTVDTGHYFATSMFADNTGWQKWMHRIVLNLDPRFPPHSYRFLPDCIVEVFGWFTGDFWWARLGYRLLFDSLLYAVIYRYARLYLTSVGAAAVVVLIVMFYPITILRYAGQLTDPLSHLSFALCLYALASPYEPAFGPSLLVGIFAKESVAVMAACRAFTGRDVKRSLSASAVYVIGAVALVVAIRLFVNHGSFSYSQVSGVERSHVLTNLGFYRMWGPMYAVTLGLLMPGAAAGWRYFDRGFKATTLIVTVGVVVSSLIFSWLSEVRNLVPAFIPLAVATVKGVEERLLPQLADASRVRSDHIERPVSSRTP